MEKCCRKRKLKEVVGKTTEVTKPRQFVVNSLCRSQPWDWILLVIGLGFDSESVR